MTTQQLNSNPAIRAGLYATLGAGAAGSAIGGIKEFAAQKSALKNPEPIIAQFHAGIKQADTFSNSFFPNAELNQLKSKTLKEQLAKFEDFVKKGKVNPKYIGKAALKMGAIGAGIGAAAVGIYYLAQKLGVIAGKNAVKISKEVYDDPATKEFHKTVVQDTVTAAKEALDEKAEEA